MSQTCGHCGKRLSARKVASKQAQKPRSAEHAIVMLVDLTASSSARLGRFVLARWDNVWFWAITIASIAGVVTLIGLSSMLFGSKPKVPSSIVRYNFDCTVSLAVPAGWVNEQSIGRSGDVHVADPNNELFIVVTSKARPFNGPSQLNGEITYPPEAVPNAMEVEPPHNILLGGYRALQRELIGSYKNEQVTIMHVVIETNENIHSVAAWCPSDRYEKNRENFLKAIDTMQFLDMNHYYRVSFYIYIQGANSNVYRSLRIVSDQKTLEFSSKKGIKESFGAGASSYSADIWQLPESISLNGHEFKLTAETFGDCDRTWILNERGYTTINIDSAFKSEDKADEGR